MDLENDLTKTVLNNYIDKDNLSYNDKMNLNEEFKKLILELFSTTIPNTIMN